MYRALPDIEAMVDTAGPLHTRGAGARSLPPGDCTSSASADDPDGRVQVPGGVVVTYHWDDPDGGFAFAEQEWIPATGVRGDDVHLPPHLGGLPWPTTVRAFPSRGGGKTPPRPFRSTGGRRCRVAQGSTASGGVVQGPPEVAGQSTIIFEAAGGVTQPAASLAGDAQLILEASGGVVQPAPATDALATEIFLAAGGVTQAGARNRRRSRVHLGSHCRGRRGPAGTGNRCSGCRDLLRLGQDDSSGAGRHGHGHHRRCSA